MKIGCIQVEWIKTKACAWVPSTMSGHKIGHSRKLLRVFMIHLLCVLKPSP